MNANTNAAIVSGEFLSKQLTDPALARLAEISLAAATGATISKDDAAFMAKYFYLLVSECRFHRRNFAAMVHRIKTTCAQEDVNPTAFLGTVPGHATS